MSHHPFPWRDPLLAALRADPFITRAAALVGIDRATVFRQRKADKDLDEAIQAAIAEGQAVLAEEIEIEILRRGKDGYYEPVVHQGRISYATERYIDENGQPAHRELLDADGQYIPLTVRKTSDALLLAAGKARILPYRTERTEITGADGGALVIDETTRRARMAAILDDARRRRAAEDFG